jgi:hypothetical protein
MSTARCTVATGELPSVDHYTRADRPVFPPASPPPGLPSAAPAGAPAESLSFKGFSSYWTAAGRRSTGNRRDALRKPAARWHVCNSRSPSFGGSPESSCPCWRERHDQARIRLRIVERQVALLGESDTYRVHLARGWPLSVTSRPPNYPSALLIVNLLFV